MVYQQARQADTIEFYDNYMKEYPAGPHIVEVKALKEKRTFERARISNKVDDYDAYIKNFPLGEYLPQVKKLREKAWFDTVVVTNTVDDYKGYLQEFPEGKYKASVKSLLDSLLDKSKQLTAKDWVENGLALKRGGEASKTELLSYFNNAIQLDPQYARAFGNRGLVYLEMKQFDKALRDFNQSIRLDGTNPKGYVYRGDTYKKIGKKIEMCVDYRKACELDVCSALQMVQADNLCL